jgi:isocitrate dehydrogenase (NAD+)
MAHTIGLIPGDGIGPEVTEAARDVIDAACPGIEWKPLAAGAAAADQYGAVLPEPTVAAIERHRLALKGPVTTPVGRGFTSVNVQLRQRFELYAAVRPVRSMPGIRTRYEDVDVVVIRENTEGLYSGLEHEVVPGVVESLKIATRRGCERIAHFGARKLHEEVAPDIEYEELIIDNGCMQLVRDPSHFDVLLLENLYGDVVSDLCAGLVGGLGVVPGSNIGDDCAVFEAVHGSAPDIAGQGLANPLALIMSGVMLLNHIGEHAAASRIKAAYDAVLEVGDPDTLTRDIGGRATTRGFAQALIARL